MGVPIFSFRLGLSFGFVLNFCCGYLSLIMVFFIYLNLWVCVLESEVVFLLFLFRTHLDINSYYF